MFGYIQRWLGLLISVVVLLSSMGTDCTTEVLRDLSEELDEIADDRDNSSDLERLFDDIENIFDDF